MVDATSISTTPTRRTEVFLTSTSLCLCPVVKVNHAVINDGKVPGPVSKKLLAAYSKLVGCDIQAQYLKHLK